MKRFVVAVLILAMMIVSGCGSKYSDETLIVEFAFWSEDKENIPDLLDAINTRDTEFLAQQVIDGKIKHADKETKVAVMSEFNNGEIVEIKFLQGRYKNKVGYTLSEFIIDVGKERELEKKRDAEGKAAEEKRLADEKARLEKVAAAEKEQFKQLAEQNPQSSDITQIACTMTEGTDAYQKLIGTTNLPEGTRLKITLAGVKKETAVSSDKTFYALFERSIIPVGEQSLSIISLDKSVQPPNVQSLDDTLTKDNGVGILGRELYTGKIDVK